MNQLKEPVMAKIDDKPVVIHIGIPGFEPACFCGHTGIQMVPANIAKHCIQCEKCVAITRAGQEQS